MNAKPGQTAIMQAVRRVAMATAARHAGIRVAEDGHLAREQAKPATMAREAAVRGRAKEDHLSRRYMSAACGDEYTATRR
jgi:hypothetical protein